MMNLKRIRGWVAVVVVTGHEEGSIFRVAVRVLLGGVRMMVGGKVDRREYFGRMRVCVRCDLFDSGLGRCRPFVGSRIGCGCYMPFKGVFSRGGCWKDEVGISGGWKMREKNRLPPSEG